MIDAAFEALRERDTVWAELTAQNPCGLWWKLAGASALRRIISEIQIRLQPFGAKLWLDEDYRSDGLPKNIIVFFNDKTTLIPLRFRDKLVLVAGEPVATAHSSGAALFAIAIVDAVENALGLKNAA